MVDSGAQGYEKHNHFKGDSPMITTWVQGKGPIQKAHLSMLLFFTVVVILCFGIPGIGNAALLTYNFQGTCVSDLNVGNGCAAFGLSDGNVVSGSVSIDSFFVSDTILTRWDDKPTFDFEFDFGNTNISVQLGAVDNLDTSEFSAMVSPDLSRITAISGGGIIPFAVFRDFETQYFVYTHFDMAEAYTNGGSDHATVRGQWLNAQASPVPEPSTMLLLGCGLMGLVWYGRKRKKA